MLGENAQWQLHFVAKLVFAQQKRFAALFLRSEERRGLFGNLNTLSGIQYRENSERRDLFQ